VQCSQRKEFGTATAVQHLTGTCAAAAAVGGGGFLVRWLLHGPVQRASRLLHDKLGIVSGCSAVATSENGSST
jgi:hypothetical protein